MAGAFRQVASCVVCGASRPLYAFNLTDLGYLTSNPLEYLPVIKLASHNERSRIQWTVHDMPEPVIRNMIGRLEQALEQLRERLPTSD